MGFGIRIYNNFKGRGDLKNGKPKVYGGSRVLCSSETNPAWQKRKCVYFYGTTIFYADIFYGTDICLKICMYTCIFTILTLGPTLNHP